MSVVNRVTQGVLVSETSQRLIYRLELFPFLFSLFPFPLFLELRLLGWTPP